MADHPDTPEAPFDARELASLIALRRLSFGAAHSLNNAFTAAIGEVTYLVDTHKDDDEIVESGQIILESLERATRITRALLRRRDARSEEVETDLGRALAELVPLLDETLGGGHPVRGQLASAEGEWIAVAADPKDVDLLVTSLVQYAADATGDPSTLTVSLERSAGEACVEIRVEANEVPADVPEAIADPSLAASPFHRASLGAARDLVSRLGGHLTAARSAPDSWRMRLQLPTL